MRKLIKIVKTFFHNWHDKKISLMLISTGCAILLAGFSNPVWLLPLVELINEKSQSDISVPESNVDYFVMGTGIIVGFTLIFSGFKYRKKYKSKNDRVIQLRHSSIEGVNYSNIDEDLDNYDIIPIDIHLYNELNNIDDFNLRMACKKQEQAVQELLVHINDSSISDVAYLGMAHIPFQFLLGYQVSDKLSMSFFEWNRTKRFWSPIKSRNKEFRELDRSADESRQVPSRVEEVVIKVGITFEIYDHQLKGHELESLNTYYLKLDPPRVDAINSIEQLNTYKKQFRDLLTSIHHKYQNLKKVHIFLSAQPSVAFSFGSSISARMDSNKEFWIYNYLGSSEIKYPWALKLSKKIENADIKVKSHV